MYSANVSVVNNKWFRRLVSVGVLLCMATVGQLQATPLDWGKNASGEAIKPLRWPNNKTINVYIEPDPDANPPDRSALLKEGMDRWGPVMTPRGITINVTVGAVPVPAPANLVRCRYRPAGTVIGEHTLGNGAGQDKGVGESAGPEGGNLNTGEVYILDSLPAGTDAEKDFLRNLGQHELTHVLGLADDANGTVTNHLQGTTPNTYNDTDTKEINTLYPVISQPAPKGNGTQQSVDPNQHQYNFNYQGLPNDHVSLINLDIHPSIVVQVIPPPGWIALNPADPAHLDPNHPFYQNYMEDCAPSRAPWDPLYTAPVSVRALNEAATLSPLNPQVQVTIITQNASMGTIGVWAGDEIQNLPGPVPAGGGAPAMSTEGLVAAVFLIGLGGVVLFAKRRRAYSA